MAKNNENNPIIVLIPIGSATTDNTQLPGFCPTKKGKILSAKLINGADVAADDTNYVTVSLQKTGGSVVHASLDSRAANQGGLTKNTAKAMALGADVELDAGENVEVDYQENGTVGMTSAVIQVEYYQY